MREIAASTRMSFQGAQRPKNLSRLGELNKKDENFPHNNNLLSSNRLYQELLMISFIKTGG